MTATLKKFNSIAGYSVGDDNVVDIIDSIGNVSAANLTVSGDANIVGNLTVLGTVSYIETTTTYITDPLVDIGGNLNGAALGVDDNKDRGHVFHYYDGKAIDAFLGWDNSNSEFTFGSDVSVTDNVVTFNEYGNVRAGNVVISGDIHITGTVSAGSVAGSVGNAIPLGYPTTAVDDAPGNLTSPGTVTSWTSDTKVTDAIDDLNEVMENVRNLTYVKAPAFTANVIAAGIGTYVGLTISSSPVTTYGSPNRWDISWGDGTANTTGITSLSPIPSHQYNTNVDSPYTVIVTAYNNGGSGTGSSASLTKADYIAIYTANPVMGFGLYRGTTGGTILSGSTLYVSEGETFYLENTTTNTGMATVTYTINWGDGNTDTISSDSVNGGVGGGRKSHTYATGQQSGTGTKTITLTLTSHSTNPIFVSAGVSNYTTSTIKIYDPGITAPANLSTKTISFSSSVGTSPYLVAGFANNRATSVVYTAGTAVNRTTSTTGTIDTVAMTSYAYDASAGILSAYVNDVDNGSITLSTGNDAGTNMSLVLDSESDYNLLTSAGVATTFASSTYSPGLFSGLKAHVAKSASAVSAGVNSLQLRHSTGGSTNVVEFVKDTVTSAPTVDLSSATLTEGTAGSYRYISSVPYYNTGSPTITLTTGKIYDWIGQTYLGPYNTATPFTIQAGTNYESTSGAVVATQTKTYAQLNTSAPSSFLTGNHPNADTGKDSSTKATVGPQTVALTASSVASVQDVQFKATNVNGTGTASTFSKKVQVFTASPSGFQEDSITCAVGGTNAVAKRIVITGTGATRAYSSSTNYYTSGLWQNNTTIAGTDSAVVRWNALKHFNTDLSTGYLPVGPDLATGRSGTQFFFGAFTRTARSSITVTISGTIRGLYFALPGTAIDAASSLNGWIDASIAYNGSGVPGANTGAGGNGTNGCAVGTNVPLGSAISAQTYTISFGTASSTDSFGNQILFSIALNSGDTVTSWSFA